RIPLAESGHCRVRPLHLPGGGLGIALSHRMDSEGWILAHAAAAPHCRSAANHAIEFHSAAPVACQAYREVRRHRALPTATFSRSGHEHNRNPIPRARVAITAVSGSITTQALGSH